jgi:hypothetical protein
VARRVVRTHTSGDGDGACPSHRWRSQCHALTISSTMAAKTMSTTPANSMWARCGIARQSAGADSRCVVAGHAQGTHNIMAAA